MFIAETKHTNRPKKSQYTDKRPVEHNVIGSTQSKSFAPPSVPGCLFWIFDFWFFLPRILASKFSLLNLSHMKFNDFFYFEFLRKLEVKTDDWEFSISVYKQPELKNSVGLKSQNQIKNTFIFIDGRIFFNSFIFTGVHFSVLRSGKQRL